MVQHAVWIFAFCGLCQYTNVPCRRDRRIAGAMTRLVAPNQYLRHSSKFEVKPQPGRISRKSRKEYWIRKSLMTIILGPEQDGINDTTFFSVCS